MPLFRRKPEQPGSASRRERRRRIVYAPVTFSEEAGVRYLHFGTEWVQGAMRLKAPDAIELEYAQQMMIGLLFIDAPGRIVQLGLGAAALTKFCYRFVPAADVIAVELNAAVVCAARAMFGLPPDDARLRVVEGDAWDFVTDPANHGLADLIQIDLYDASARGPVLDSEDFYRQVRACLRAPGVATVNLFGDHPSFSRNEKTLRAAFAGRIVTLPEVHQGNRVAVAFNGPPLEVSFADLYARAERIQRAFGLPATDWVDALRLTGPRNVLKDRFSV